MSICEIIYAHEGTYIIQANYQMLAIFRKNQPKCDKTCQLQKKSCLTTRTSSPYINHTQICLLLEEEFCLRPILQFDGQRSTTSERLPIYTHLELKRCTEHHDVRYYDDFSFLLLAIRDYVVIQINRCKSVRNRLSFRIFIFSHEVR